MKNKKRGFTLIELLVVVLIIGILAAVALPQYQKAVSRARSAEVLSQIKTLAQAAEVYALEAGAWPENFDLLSVDLPGEKVSFRNSDDKRIGKYNNCVLIGGRIDCGSQDSLHQPSFLYVSDYAPAAHHPVPGKRYYCYYVSTGDGKDDIRKNLCKVAGGQGDGIRVMTNSIWFPLD